MRPQTVPISDRTNTKTIHVNLNERMILRRNVCFNKLRMLTLLKMYAQTGEAFVGLLKGKIISESFLKCLGPGGKNVFTFIPKSCPSVNNFITVIVPIVNCEHIYRQIPN